MPQSPAYIIAARRSAIGRVGGLHRHRRIETLTAPIVQAALEDARLDGDQVDEVIIGNTTAGGNPARLIALAAGIRETASASTVDRQCGSGLDAILNAIRIIGAGEADIIVAGGADSPSTAPWRIAKPRSLHQVPHFIGVDPAILDECNEPQHFEATEALARRHGITRSAQDQHALQSYLKAQIARDASRFVGEIVPLKMEAAEARDQSAGEPEVDELESQVAFLEPSGTLTPGNTSSIHDGAAIVVIVSQKIYDELGSPGALKLVDSAAQGVAPDQEAEAPILAMGKLYKKLNGFDRSTIRVVEIAETSAAQVIALRDQADLNDDIINPSGGEIARGHPVGASGAVLIVRLFTDLVRAGAQDAGQTGEAKKFGAVTQGAIGGLGLAALFEAV